MACTASRTGRDLQRYNQGRRQVVGCIPYRKINQSSSIHGTLIEEFEVLMISSQKNPRLMFPKGGWEIDESMKEAASRETEEEAGVVGIVGSQLGKWNFKSRSQGTINEGHMFPLLVTEEKLVWPEQNARQRVWMKVKDAREACVHWWMKEALDILAGRLMKEEEHGRVSVSQLMQLPRKEEECGDVVVSQPVRLQRKEDERSAFLVSKLLLLPRKGEEHSDLLVSQLLHLPRKEEECRDVSLLVHLQRCSLEVLIAEEPRGSCIIVQSGEEEVDCCLVS